jgi:hypothetical protein
LVGAPLLTRGVDVGAGLFGGVGGSFLKLMPYRSRNRQITEIDANVPRSPSRSRISARVRSAASATSCNSQSRCTSSAPERRSPPCGRASKLPRCRHACVSLTTKREQGHNFAHAAARLNLPNHSLAKVYRIGACHPAPQIWGYSRLFRHICEAVDSVS